VADGIDVDGGGMDMYPAETRTAITGFGSVARAIAATFEENLGVVAGLDSQLGQGTLGARAYMQYQPFVDQVVPQIRELNGACPGYADSGMTCVDRYEEQDRINQQNLQGVQGPAITNG
jgi:hypothetical protein